MKCAVIGGGAWGTALANVLAANGHDVALWAREPDVVESINETQSVIGGVLTSFVMELVVYPAIYEVWKWHSEVKKQQAPSF